MTLKAIWGTKDLTQEVDKEVQESTKRLKLPKSTARLSHKHSDSLKSCLTEVEDTVHDAAWTMFRIGKVAWLAGWLMKLEPGPTLKVALGGVIVAAFGLVVVLGEDALRDRRPDRRGYYQGIGTLALNALKSL